ncbi:MAG: nuclear transport factor 2 family protein [Cyclobacteriaceae bacterium]|nr:nuclear transport factor 2 family protein [Cyclobacteriaceae bacterium]
MKNLTLFFLLITSFAYAQTMTPEQLAEHQLQGYNERNIDKFLEAYSDSVKVYMFPDKLMYTGKDKMKSNYEGRFNSNPDLHCTLKSRMVLGNTVIDEERVLLNKSRPLLEAIAIYKVAAGKIQEVYFITK